MYPTSNPSVLFHIQNIMSFFLIERRLALLPITLLAALPATTHAGESAPPLTTPAAAVAQPDPWKKWATLYKNDQNPILQEFKLRGRYQGQQHWLDSNQGDAQDWENRRSRLGFDATLWNRKIEIRLDAQSNDAFDPLYDSLVDAYVKWKPDPAFSLTLGRQKPQIGGYDWLIPTIITPTFERSQIFNQLKVDRASGAVAEGKAGNFTWQGGIYSNDMDQEFGQFDGGFSYGAGIGYRFGEDWGLKKANGRVDWLHSDHETGDLIFSRYDDLFSATLELQDGLWSLATEAFYGTGSAAPDVFGFYLQPTWDLVPKKLQLVGRYTFSAGDGPDSVVAPSRYERTAPNLVSGGKGDRYQAGYLGLQYFIQGDHLKLMAGAEYSQLDGGAKGGDLDSLTLLTGIRLSF